MTKEFMQQFCADDELRPVMNMIFPVGDYYTATDGRHMLLAKASECGFPLDYDKTKHGKTPDVLSLIDPANLYATHYLNLSDLKEWIERNAKEDEVESVQVPTKFKPCDCDECDNGTITLHEYVSWGKRDFELEEEVECPVCHGFGKIPVDPDFDPDDCFCEDDVENWVTYKKKKTGRKIFGTKEAARLSTIFIRPSHMIWLVRLMEYLGVETAPFCQQKKMIAFLFGSTTYVICGLSEEVCKEDNWKFIKDIPCSKID